MLQRPGILALLLAIATTASLSLMAAPASYASAPLGLYLTGPTDSVCVQADPAHGGAGIQLDAQWHQLGSPTRLWDLRPLGNGNRHIQDYGNALCVRATAKDNAAVWA